MLVAKVIVPTRPCYIDNILLTNFNDTVFFKVCYQGGVLATTCPRLDTFDLGIVANSQIKIRSVFQDNYNGQCVSSHFYQDTFDFTLNSGQTSITALNFLNSSFLIYPNPTNDKLTCTVDKPTQNTTLQLFTTAGRAAAPAMPVTQTNTEIDVSTLPAGLYFLQLQDDKQRVVKKFVKY
jgi:hypothetical protein